MLVVRTVFQLKFGKAQEVKTHLKDIMDYNKKLGISNMRALFDITGPSYTLVMELEFESLSDFESSQKKVFTSKEWGEKYQKLTPLVDSAYKEIFTVFNG